MTALFAAIVAGGCSTEASPPVKVDTSTGALAASVPLKIYPTKAERARRAALAPIVTAPGALKYEGGRILSHVQVVQVLWGDGVNVDVATKLSDYYKAVLVSPYMDWLGEYDTINVPDLLKRNPGTQPADSKQKIGHGAFVKTVKITPTNTAPTINATDVTADLTKYIDNGTLPAPVPDDAGGYATLYMFDFPPTITSIVSAGASSCVQFCGIHGQIDYKGRALAYGMHPDLGANGCETGCGGATGADKLFKNSTEVHAHELIEAITDPDDAVLAWYDRAPNQGEIGDICANDAQGLGTSLAVVAGFTVQTEWSNAMNKCASEAASALPKCIDGTRGACSPCAADADCSGATPVCALDPTDFKAGLCVACKDNTKCTGGLVCNKSQSSADDTCVPCQKDGECKAPTARCLMSSPPASDGGSEGGASDAGSAGGKCVECTASADCATSTKGTVCDTPTNVCRGCASDTECTGDTHCVTDKTAANAGKCAMCTKDADCKTGTVCDTAKNTCVGCTTAAQCKNPKPACDSATQACIGCKANADCTGATGGPECNATAGTCGPVGSGGSSGSSGASGGGGGNTNTTTSSCAVSRAGGGTQTGLGFAGALFALGLVARRRRRD